MLTCRQSVSLSPAVGCGSLCNSSAIENLCLYIIAPNLKLNKLQVYTKKRCISKVTENYAYFQKNT